MPVILVLNVMDEAEALGLNFELESLAQLLGVPLTPMVATQKCGLDNLKAAISIYRKRPAFLMVYNEAIEER